jgi:hypothetical protein
VSKANPFAPESPFADMRARAKELLKLLADARLANPGMHTVVCASWLNGLAPFRELFPAAWAASASEPLDLAFHLGWWGQLMDRSGGFHAGNAAFLRRTGEWRYQCVACSRGVEEVEAHLRARLEGAESGQPITG